MTHLNLFISMLAQHVIVFVAIGALGFPLLAKAKEFDCLIEPNQTVEIRSPVEGLIDSVHVERGATIKAGQILVQLQSDVERSNMETAKYRSEMTGRINAARNRLAFATKKFNRAQQLYKDKFVSIQEVDEAETEKRLADSELDEAIESQELAKREYSGAIHQLKLRTLRSPFDGYVVDRLLNPGDLAESGTGRKPILKLAQINPLKVEVYLPQETYGHIKLNSKATVVADGFEGKYVGQVAIVDKVVDAASGMFGVRLELANPNGVLPGGIRCKVEFLSGVPQVTGKEE